MWCWGVARRAVDARGEESPFVKERQAHGRCKLLRLGRKTAHDSEVRDTRKSGNIINEHILDSEVCLHAPQAGGPACDDERSGDT